MEYRTGRRHDHKTSPAPFQGAKATAVGATEKDWCNPSLRDNKAVGADGNCPFHRLASKGLYVMIVCRSFSRCRVDSAQEGIFPWKHRGRKVGRAVDHRHAATHRPIWNRPLIIYHQPWDGCLFFRHAPRKLRGICLPDQRSVIRVEAIRVSIIRSKVEFPI